MDRCEIRGPSGSNKQFFDKFVMAKLAKMAKLAEANFSLFMKKFS